LVDVGAGLCVAIGVGYCTEVVLPGAGCFAPQVWVAWPSHFVAKVKHDSAEVKHDVAEVKHVVTEVKHVVAEVKHDAAEALSMMYVVAEVKMAKVSESMPERHAMGSHADDTI
jgi:hypothetical protein